MRQVRFFSKLILLMLGTAASFGGGGCVCVVEVAADGDGGVCGGVGDIDVNDCQCFSLRA